METGVLAEFEQRKTAGEACKVREHAEAQFIQRQPSFRYRKAIPTEAVCLSCHDGDSIAPAVADAIKAYYAEDKARDFDEGDIRGAFT